MMGFADLHQDATSVARRVTSRRIAGSRIQGLVSDFVNIASRWAIWRPSFPYWLSGQCRPRTNYPEDYWQESG